MCVLLGWWIKRMTYKLKFKPVNQVVIENTKTNRNALPVEKAMITAMEVIAKQTKEKYFLPVGDLLSPEIIVADTRLNEVIRDTIRASVQEFYLLGTTYANDTFQLNMLITERDAKNIKDISLNIQARFISNLVKWINREKQIVQLEAAGLPMQNNHLDIEAAIERLAMVSSTRGINHGTIDKLLQLKKEGTSTLQTQSAAIKKVEEKFLEDQGFEEIEGPLVRWVTAQDDKVCPICEEFDDDSILYDIATDDLPIPPDETHPNCRCRLMIVDPNIEYQELVGSYVEVAFG
jgi:hypothetical protein